MTMMYVLALLLVAGSLNMISAQKTDYVVIPPAMSMDDFNSYVSICYTVWGSLHVDIYLTKTHFTADLKRVWSFEDFFWVF